MNIKYKQWLNVKYPKGGTANSRYANCIRIEKYYGDLEAEYDKDKCQQLLKDFIFTKTMDNDGIAPYHKVPISGNKVAGTSTLRNALKLYIEFKANHRSNQIITNNSDNVIIDSKKNIRDSYERFFDLGYINKEKFFDFGLQETIYSDIKLAKVEWEKLKNDIFNNNAVYIRGFGRDGAGTEMFIDFYKYVFGNENIKRDSTNNAIPTKIISTMTGYIKKKNIFNYQIAHVFGRTKNIFAFAAPWNIVYTPRIIDPFTGHESTGTYVVEYQKLFKSQTYEMFKELIEDFNKMMSEQKIIEKKNEYFQFIKKEGRYKQQEILKLKNAVESEFELIKI